MSTFWTSEEVLVRISRLIRHGSGSHGHLHRLGSDDFDPLTPDLAAWPIAPKNWVTGGRVRRPEHQCRVNHWIGFDGPIDGTHPTRFEGAETFLTPCTQLTDTAIT